MHRPLRSPVDLALLAVAVGWGSSYLAAKELITPDGVFAFLVLRFAVAALGLAVVLAPRLRHLSGSEVAVGTLCGLLLSVVFTLETFGVVGTSASNAGLIISLTIVMTPLCEHWIRRTHLPSACYGAAVVAVAGVGLLTQAGGFAMPNVGDLWILFAAAARAVHVTVLARLSAGRTFDSGRVTLVQLCTGLVVFATLSPFTGRGVGAVAAHLTTRSWLLVGYLALVCTVFAFVVQTWAVRRTSPARVSLLLGTEPLCAAAFGVLLAGDPVTAVGVSGAALILLGTHWGRVADARRGLDSVLRAESSHGLSHFRAMDAESRHASG
ncbi:multidrug transporter [Mycolicibacterium madagascariense]|uniref:Multidrug transporter n=1 Tax=Mycolicibacterium madagascariense TaxID=212765 RepID=A0A7I7XGZ5_9MYCO|nr:multidrug transporter [Mycolicibacterium madagascariense]